MVWLQYLQQSINNLLRQNNGQTIVILDAHDYMQWNSDAEAGGGSFGTTISIDQIGMIWRAIIEMLKTQEKGVNSAVDVTNRHFWFEISNEPNSMSAQQVYQLDLAGLHAIRVDENLKNKVLVEGTAWSGIHGWFDPQSDSQGDDKSNADVFQDLTQKYQNVAIAMHEYFDSNYSGTSLECQLDSDHQHPSSQLSSWMKINKIHVILDEFESSDTRNCQADVTSFLNDLYQSAAHASSTSSKVMGINTLSNSSTGGHILGWTVWSCSPIYRGSNYISGPDANLMTDIYSHYLTTVSSNAKRK